MNGTCGIAMPDDLDITVALIILALLVAMRVFGLTVGVWIP
jgi:hypothetical protein